MPEVRGSKEKSRGPKTMPETVLVDSFLPQRPLHLHESTVSLRRELLSLKHCIMSWDPQGRRLRHQSSHCDWLRDDHVILLSQ